jgi:hypothetical protein
MTLPQTPQPVWAPTKGQIARIVFKDEGWDEEGRTRGPAYAESAKGDLLLNYGWITRKQAERLADSLGVDVLDV